MERSRFKSLDRRSKKQKLGEKWEKINGKENSIVFLMTFSLPINKMLCFIFSFFDQLCLHDLPYI